MSIHRIVRRHRTSIGGQLQYRRPKSDALGIRKGHFVYLSPGAEGASGISLLYLFRGHEREWVNLHEDNSRTKSTAIEDIDRLIEQKILPPMVIVMPGLNSIDNRIPSLGINMVGAVPRSKGLGSGRFWEYLTEELIPGIDTAFPATNGGRRLMAGFSLGGYTVANLAVRTPGVFDDAAIYDGLFMWPEHNDPREDEDGAFTDPIWRKSAIFDAAFGKPRDRKAMLQWNPTDHLNRAPADVLDQIRKTTFWIASAATDGDTGNRDRACFFVDLLRKNNIPIGFSGQDILFDPDANHSWHWTDRFLISFLRGAHLKKDSSAPQE